MNQMIACLLFLGMSLNSIAQSVKTDTVIYTNGNKTIKTYDEHKQLLREEVSYLDTVTSIWINKYKDENVYNVKGQKTMESRFYWDQLLKEWRGGFRREYVLNEFGDEQINTSYKWDSQLKSFKGDERTEYLFIGKGKDHCTIKYNWNDSNAVWQPNYKECTIKDSVPKTEFYTTYRYDKHYTLIPNMKLETRYTSRGLPLFEEAYLWSVDSCKWIGYKKHEAIYDTLSKNRIELFYKWAGSTFEINRKMEYKFDTLRHPTLTLKSMWDKELNCWIVKSKEEVTYTADGQVLTESYGYSEDKDWVVESLKEYRYNKKGQNTEVVEWANYLTIKDYSDDTSSITAVKMMPNGDGTFTKYTTVTYNPKDNYLVRTDKTKMMYKKDGVEYDWIEYRWDLGKNKWVKTRQSK